VKKNSESTTVSAECRAIIERLQNRTTGQPITKKDLHEYEQIVRDQIERDGVEVIPKRFQHCRLANLEEYPEKKAKALAAVVGEGLSLFITGDKGRGKTHLACALAVEWMKQRTKAVEEHAILGGLTTVAPNLSFLPAVEFFVELKATFDSRDLTEQDVIRKYCSQQLLILDDLGVEKVSDWSKQMIYALIDRRYRNMQQMIITSNLSLRQLAAQIDDRITSRIMEMGPVIGLTGADHRRKIADDMA